MLAVSNVQSELIKNQNDQFSKDRAHQENLKTLNELVENLQKKIQELNNQQITF